MGMIFIQLDDRDYSSLLRIWKLLKSIALIAVLIPLLSWIYHVYL
jgi:hypothetical protein